MSGFCCVDSLRELDFKSQKALSFNVLYGTNYEKDSYIGIPGFILLAGCIYPPKNKRKGFWFPIGYLGRKLAEIIYEELDKELEVCQLKDKFPLNNKEIAIEELVKSSAIYKFFPKLTGNL